jgi:hypothetical protein
MSRTDIFHLFNKNQTSAAIATALQKLLAYKKAAMEKRGDGRGKPVEVWVAI